MHTLFLLYLSFILGSPQLNMPYALQLETVPLSQFSIDSVTQLSRVWVLKYRLIRNKESLTPTENIEKLELAFYADSSYRLTRFNPIPNIINGDEVTENGSWELHPSDGFISVAIRHVNGRAIRSAKVYRWQVAKLSAHQLVLKQLGKGIEYLVFEEKRN